jgi:hypothetical protein
MFISKEELDQRRSESFNLVERIHPKNDGAPSVKVASFDPSRFKNDGTQRATQRLSPEMRAVVAAAAIISGPEVAAEIGDVSVGYAEVLARGEYNNSGKSPEDREARNQILRDGIYEALGNIREKAREKLLKVLDIIDEDALENIPNRERAKVAAQMANHLSGVIDRTINKGEHLHDSRSSHLHLYAPERREVSDFKVKVINQLPDANPEEANATSSSE